jgi:hypothetical protein
MVRTGSSYLSQSDTQLAFGLGSHTRADSLEIRWPNGRSSRHVEIPADRTIALRPP